MPLILDASVMIIRLANAADRVDVEIIVRSAYALYIPRIGRPPGPMLDDYAALITAERVHVLDQKGTILGILVLLPEADTMLLDNVAIIPAAQGTGLGRRLLAFAEERARQAGFHSIRLYTNEKMTENIALYTYLGYVETHRGEERGLRRVFMRKVLD